MAIVIGILATFILVVPFVVAGIVRMTQAREESRLIAELETNGSWLRER